MLADGRSLKDVARSWLIKLSLVTGQNTSPELEKLTAVLDVEKMEIKSGAIYVNFHGLVIVLKGLLT